jgi:hypothetical protein
LKQNLRAGQSWDVDYHGVCVSGPKAVLHFKAKDHVNLSEALDLYSISSVQLGQKKIQTHKCVVAKMASEDRCTEIKGAVTNLVSERHDVEEDNSIH